MQKITKHEALQQIQDKKNFIIRCNKGIHKELQCYEWQKYIKENWKFWIIIIKNKIIVHPKVKFIYLYN